MGGETPHVGPRPSGPDLDTLTLVICTRDRPAMLAQALDRAVSVTPDAVAILVVDSASRTPETREVAGSHARVDYVRSSVPGLSIAPNLGLREASSSLVAYTDDDCLLSPGWDAALRVWFADPGVECVTGELRAPGAGEGRGVVRSMRADTRHALDCGHGAFMAFRREPLLALGGFDPMLGAGRRYGGAEDMDAFARVLASGGTVVHDPRIAVDHTNVRVGVDHVALHAAYGRGLGAMCGRWLRRSPAIGLALTARALRRAAFRALRGNPSVRRSQLALFSQSLRAMWEVRALPWDGPFLADLDPPTPTTTGVP